jgi:1-acyl-sn-glycerol-3-phosphate acyltransferase
MIKVIRYCWLFLTALVCLVFLYILNKTYIFGRKNLPQTNNLLIIANHQSWVDSWALTFAVAWPWMFWHFSLMPWHTPEFNNFYKNSILAIISWLSQCLPVTRKQTTLSDLKPIASKLQSGTLMVFPEGTRHRGTNQNDRDYLYKWESGPACLACLTKATVLPIAIRGMENVWPVGQKLPKLFGNTIVIVIGQPMNLNHYWQTLGENGFDPIYNRALMKTVSAEMKNGLQTILTLASKIFYLV